MAAHFSSSFILLLSLHLYFGGIKTSIGPLSLLPFQCSIHLIIHNFYILLVSSITCTVIFYSHLLAKIWLLGQSIYLLSLHLYKGWWKKISPKYRRIVWYFPNFQSQLGLPHYSADLYFTDLLLFSFLFQPYALIFRIWPQLLLYNTEKLEAISKKFSQLPCMPTINSPASTSSVAGAWSHRKD